MCSGSEEGSYLRLIDLVYHSALGLRVIKKKKKYLHEDDAGGMVPDILDMLPEFGTINIVTARFWP